MDTMDHFPAGFSVILVSGVIVSALPDRWSDVQRIVTLGTIALLYYLGWEYIRNSAGLMELIFFVSFGAPVIGVSKIGDFIVSFPWF